MLIIVVIVMIEFNNEPSVEEILNRRCGEVSYDVVGNLFFFFIS